MRLALAMIKDAVERWSITDASELYDVPSWGKGYFGVNAQGHLVVHPTRDPNRPVAIAGPRFADFAAVQRHLKGPAPRN
jgi:arginine decarboxylase-like protein